jgi:superfamily I DNA/RNA helicase
MPRVSPERWSPSDGINLEPNALAAVKEVDQHLAVIAGPGAGKTEMLAQRASFLLMTGACPPSKRILALCFKREAVRTLEERVWRRCGETLSARFQCVTFHSFAKSIADRFRLRISEANRPGAAPFGQPAKPSWNDTQGGFGA